MAEFLAGLDPWVVYAVIFALTFGESAAFLGLVFPGEIGLVAAAGLAAHSGMEPIPLGVAAALGAAAGGACGYELFRRRGHRILAWAPLARRLGAAPAAWRLPGGLAGWTTVALARFNQVTRAAVPAMAGLGGMPKAIFASANAAGAVLWAGTFTAVGYLAAEWWESRSGTVGLAVTGAILVAAVTARWALRRRRSRRQTNVRLSNIGGWNHPRTASKPSSRPRTRSSPPIGCQRDTGRP